MAAWLSCKAGQWLDGRYGGGMFVEGACIHTHTSIQTTQRHAHRHTHRLAGTILASEWRSQSHRHSFQEGQPQSHCAGFPTGEGRLERAERKEEKKEESVCVHVCKSVYVGRGCME